MGAVESSFKNKFTKLLETLPISTYQREIICSRYVAIVTDAERDYHTITISYYVLVCIVVVIGVLISSLIILNEFFVDSRILFWIVWTLSIAVALSNKLLYSFNVSKKYILEGIVLGKLYSECWMFLAGGGKYKKCIDMDKRFELFCDRVEKIKLKSIESTSDLEFGDAPNAIIAASPRPPSPATENTIAHTDNIHNE